MDIKQLQYFLAAAEHLNFSRAAESLYISQPALSYQIAELEQELGTPLFLRDRRKMFLTPAGGALLPLASKLVLDMQEIRNLAQKGFQQDELPQSLAIAFDKTEDHFESTGATELVGSFIRQHPELDVTMQQSDWGECIRGLLEETLDIAFLVLHHNKHLPPLLNSRVIHQDRLVLVCRKDPDIHTCADALHKYRLTLVEGKPLGNTRILRCFENMGLEITPIVADSLPAAFTYAQAGLGVLSLPENYFNQHPYENLMALEIPDPSVDLAHVLVWNKAHQNPAIQFFIAQAPEPGKSK